MWKQVLVKYVRNWVASALVLPMLLLENALLVITLFLDLALLVVKV